MLWHNPKVIFIHIPKTGGSSIENFAHRCRWLLSRDGKIGQHSTLQNCADLVGDLSEYKIFTVVRPTADRILSAYMMYHRRKSFAFSLDLNGRSYVSFPEFYGTIDNHSLHCEDIFHYLEVDGKIPEHVHMLDFRNLEGDFKKFWADECGFELSTEFPHYNQVQEPDDQVREYLMADPGFHEFIERVYADEVEYLREFFAGS